MKKLLISFLMLFCVSVISAQESTESENNYILTEIWKAKPSWYQLSTEERTKFFEDKIKPLLMETMEGGADIVGTAVNNNTGTKKWITNLWLFGDSPTRRAPTS